MPINEVDWIKAIKKAEEGAAKRLTITVKPGFRQIRVFQSESHGICDKQVVGLICATYVGYLSMQILFMRSVFFEMDGT